MRSITAFLLGMLLGLIPLHFFIQAHFVKPHVRKTGYPVEYQHLLTTEQYTVLISHEGFGGISRGTGILIDRLHVLTCFHVAEGANSMWIYPFPGSQVIHGDIVYGNPSLDLAIVQLSTPVDIPHYASFASSVTVGEPLIIVGNMLGSMTWFTTYGIVSALDGRYVLTDGLIHGGNSGGPWIDEAGKVVALTDFGFQYRGKDLQISGGISSDALHSFLFSWYLHENQLLLK